MRGLTVTVPWSLESDDAGSPGTTDAAGPSLAQEGAAGCVEIGVTQALCAAVRYVHLAKLSHAAQTVKDGPIRHQVT